jgi:cyclic beta-1,2-glucan synthetase
MYSAGMEWILGFHLQAGKLFMDPCIPTHWPGFELEFHFHSADYEISVQNPMQVSRGVQTLELDGKSISRAEGIPLADDGKRHVIRIVLG